MKKELEAICFRGTLLRLTKYLEKYSEKCQRHQLRVLENSQSPPSL